MSSKKTLHEVCVELGITRRTIQRYEKAGLVSASDRNKYGHLLYDEVAQKRIAKIRFFQELGFWVKEIKGLIDAPNVVIKEAYELLDILAKDSAERSD